MTVAKKRTVREGTTRRSLAEEYIWDYVGRSSLKGFKLVDSAIDILIKQLTPDRNLGAPILSQLKFPRYLQRQPK